ncbi:lysophospholipid acyltransferase 5 isoform X1 [Hydra vulgaris]|uniref:lysophospholipid acyltransferase 5 isoform X1 n=1 Tax=Hydra vulgaris TaxID=6087 RepID=UPI0032E9D2D1
MNQIINMLYNSSGSVGFHFINISKLASYLGTAEAGLRFLIGLFIGYPLAIQYILMSKSSANVKHAFFVISGLLINYFVFGINSIYTLLSVFATWLSFCLFGGTIMNVIIAIFFHTIYLSVGYATSASSSNYDVKWTTPQCMLCLRLIGLAWDVYDGLQNPETLSEDQKKNCVKNVPTILELFGFSYCFCGFLSGPQFSYRRYISFVNEELIDKNAKRIRFRYLDSIKKIFAALSVIVFHQIMDPYYRPNQLFESSYFEKPFMLRITEMSLIYYVQFTRYVIVWCISESVCMVIGISYNGMDEKGNAKWNGVQNFKFRKFVFGAFFQDIIESFNISTNLWSGRYIFRRLRFMRNKLASHVLTLFFLAVWHGFYIGYFIMFAMEFLSVIMERQVCSVFKKLCGYSYNELPILLKTVVQLSGAIMKFYMCGFFAMSFILLRWRRIKVVYEDVYYWPLIIIGVWFACAHPIFLVLSKIIKKQFKKEKKE